MTVTKTAGDLFRAFERSTSLMLKLIAPIAVVTGLFSLLSFALVREGIRTTTERALDQRAALLAQLTSEVVESIPEPEQVTSTIRSLQTAIGSSMILVVTGDPARVEFGTESTLVGLSLEDLPQGHVLTEVREAFRTQRPYRGTLISGRGEQFIYPLQRPTERAQAQVRRGTVIISMDRQSVARENSRLSIQVGTLLLAGLIIVITLVYCAVRRFVFDPLRHLHQGIAACARGDDWSSLLRLSLDELGRVGLAVGDLVDNLRLGEERSLALLNSTLDAVISLSEGGIITHVNRAGRELLGYTEEELKGQRLAMLGAVRSANGALMELLDEFMKSGERESAPMNFSLRARDTSHVSVTVVFRRIELPEQRLVVLIARAGAPSAVVVTSEPAVDPAARGADTEESLRPVVGAEAEESEKQEREEEREVTTEEQPEGEPIPVPALRLRAFLAEIESSLEAIGRERELEFRCEVRTEVPDSIRADRTLLQRTLELLVGEILPHCHRAPGIGLTVKVQLQTRDEARLCFVANPLSGRKRSRQKGSTAVFRRDTLSDQPSDEHSPEPSQKLVELASQLGGTVAGRERKGKSICFDLVVPFGLVHEQIEPAGEAKASPVELTQALKRNSIKWEQILTEEFNAPVESSPIRPVEQPPKAAATKGAKKPPRKVLQGTVSMDRDQLAAIERGEQKRAAEKKPRLWDDVARPASRRAIEAPTNSVPMSSKQRALFGGDPAASDMKRLLESDGYEVVSAQNKKEFLSLLQAKIFDLIVLDLDLPELQAGETASDIRESERGSGTHVPIVALFDSTKKPHSKSATGSGIDVCLSKELGDELLLARIRELRK